MIRHTILVLFSFLSIYGFSQQKRSGIILDIETKEPLEFVSVFNDENHTLSNADGRFSFTSKKDTVIFYQTGYVKLASSFNLIQDTIFLTKNVLQLNEVIVTNAKSLLQTAIDSIPKNYSFKPYKEKFFIRSLVKKDDSIWRIQDIQGKVSRKALYYTKDAKRTKKDFIVELTNMRKLGVHSDDDNTYLILPSLIDLFKSSADIFINESDYELTESNFDQGRKIKLEFKSFPSEKNREVIGYYIINKQNLAIETYYIKSVPLQIEYKKNKWLRYRNTFHEKLVNFKFNKTTNTYYISSAKISDVAEFTNEEKSFSKNYSTNTIIVTSDNFGNYNVKNNSNTHKDIFKLKYPYNSEYWQSQNQLLLTEEMQEFIRKMGQENSEYNVRSNMD